MTQIDEARERLLPCPFCGDEGEKEVNGLVQGGETVNDWVRCLVCNSTARLANWNRRAEEAKTCEAETRYLNLLLDVRRLAEGGERTGLFDDVEAVAQLLARAAAPAAEPAQDEGVSAAYQLAAHVAQAPEWGFRDPVGGGFVADDSPFDLANAVTTAEPALVQAARKALSHLINLQPHIPQACLPGHEAFIDTHVDQAITALRRALGEA